MLTVGRTSWGHLCTFFFFLRWDIWPYHCQKEEQSYALQKVLPKGRFSLEEPLTQL